MEVDADAVGDDPALAELAEQQRKAALALLAKVDNLDSALVKLGEADFYGLAALEVCGSWETRMRWEPIEPWHLYRPLPNGPVFYNEQADTVPQRAEELAEECVIIRTAPAMHLPVMFLISRMSHSEEQWDAFIDTYGLPNIFFELPAAMDERRALELDAIVKRLTGDGRGTLPNGTKIQTVETQQRDGTLFEQRGKWCRDAIISLVLGGTLTMETAPNSGTLAGNAHADSFAELCEGSAAGIASAVDEQFLRPLLRKVFPNQPILVSFEFRPVDAEDAQQVAQTLATLKTAGWQVSPETASEMLGFEVLEAPEPQQPAAPYGMPFGNTAPAAGVVTNAADTPAEEAPLTKAELDALALVQNAMDPDVLRQKAATIAGRLYEAMQTGKQGETVENKKRKVTGKHADGSDCTAKKQCPKEAAATDQEAPAAQEPKEKPKRKLAAGIAAALDSAKQKTEAARTAGKKYRNGKNKMEAAIHEDCSAKMDTNMQISAKNLHRDCGIPWNQGKKLYCAVAEQVGECFEKAYTSYPQAINPGAKNAGKKELWHFLTKVKYEGATAPVEANITVARFGKDPTPQIYSIILQKEGYRR